MSRLARRLTRRLTDIDGKDVSPTLHIAERQRAGDPLVFLCGGCGLVLVDQASDAPLVCDCGAVPCDDCAAKRRAMSS